MDRQDFESTVSSEGFALAHRMLDAHLQVEEHDHAWDTKGLVIGGSFIIDCGDDDVRHYGPGEVFELEAGIAHRERTGPEGAELIVGRRKLDRE